METMTLIMIAGAFLLGGAMAWVGSMRRQQRVEAAHKKELASRIDRNLYDELKSSLTAKHNEMVKLVEEVARQEVIIDGLRETREEAGRRQQETEERFTLQFENLANRIFEEKARALNESSAVRLESVIKPFNDKIANFGRRVEETYINGTKERTSLSEQLKQLMEANHALSDGAVRLTQALKGDSQFQGHWGEIQLTRLLESAGLKEGVHFSTQDSHKSERGDLLRTDVIIHLPQGKHLILDSKVSLKAFEQYFNAETEEDRSVYLSAHVESINNHIRTLGEKNYQKLGSLNPPDYVLMFMPLEPSFIAAVQADPGLYERALERNIAIVSPSTLMATLRTITYIWKNENQTRNVIEIAREAGSLYDKFVAYLNDMDQLGKRLAGAQREYDSAMNKLATSTRRGGTIIGRIEKLREMGAETSKRLPEKYLIHE